MNVYDILGEVGLQITKDVDVGLDSMSAYCWFVLKHFWLIVALMELVVITKTMKNTKLNIDLQPKSNRFSAVSFFFISLSIASVTVGDITSAVET